jgi:hypothetical protein
VGEKDKGIIRVAHDPHRGEFKPQKPALRAFFISEKNHYAGI